MKTLFRAKKIDSDEYVEGYLIELEEMFYISCPQNIESSTAKESTSVYLNENCASIDKDYFVAIDQETLAIHFEDMLDSQGNKIFASLSEDGKGGDIMKDDEYYGIAKYKDSRFVVEYENVEECLYEGNFEVIGIQE